MQNSSTDNKPAVLPKGRLALKRQQELKEKRTSSERISRALSSSRSVEDETKSNVSCISADSSNDEVFKTRADSSSAVDGIVKSAKRSGTVNVQQRTEEFEETIRNIRIKSDRDEYFQQQSKENRRKYLEERLKRRNSAAKKSENFPNESKTDYGGYGPNTVSMEQCPSNQSNVGQFPIQEISIELEDEPPPAPPASRKEVIYRNLENIEYFEDLEDHATGLESEDVTFRVLMNTLLINNLTELERARILFHWISSQDLNAIDFPDKVAEDSPYGHLKAIKEERSTYSTVFKRLCRAANLHCKTIEGFVKCHGYFPDHLFSQNPKKFRSTWNAVYIDRQWRFIETNWGARHIEDEKLVYKYEEFYFLTDPDEFINSHFPDEKAWQLLHKPVTLQYFETSVEQWPLFYELRVTKESHQNGLIQVGRDGFVQIRLGIPPTARQKNSFGFGLKTKKGEKLVESKNHLVLHHQTNQEEIFDVHLNHIGNYIITLHGYFVDKNKESSSLCRYQINSTTSAVTPTSLYIPPFPTVHPCYGPSKNLDKFGLSAVSHKGPTIRCDGTDGVVITFSPDTDLNGITFFQELGDSENTFKKFAVHYQKNDSIQFLAKVPCSGSFKLTLYAKHESEELFTAFCHYLLYSSQKYSENEISPFPAISNGRLGPLQPTYGQCALKQIYPLPDVEFAEVFLQGNVCQLLFEHPEPLNISTNLKSANQKLVDEHVMVIKDYNCTFILVNPPGDKNETFLLEIFASVLEAENLSYCFAAILRQNGVITTACPTSPGTWGHSGSDFYKRGNLRVTYRNALPACKLGRNLDTIPYRMYAGGPDMEMILHHTEPLYVNSKLHLLGKCDTEEMKQYCFVSSNQENCTTISVRFPAEGIYSVTLYGENIDNKETDSLSQIFRCTVVASCPSKCAEKFPMSFRLWNRSFIQLHSPLKGVLAQNEEIKVKVTMGKFEESSVLTYSKLSLLENGKTYISPSKQSGCVYEWDYIPTPESKLVSLLVKSKEEEKSMHYALEYEIK